MTKQARTSTQEFADPAVGIAPGRFFAGFRFSLSGLAILKAEPGLRGLSLLPALINVVLYLVFCVVGFYFLGDLLNWVGPESGHWYSFLRYLVGLLLIPVILVVALLVAMVVGSLVNGEVYAVLSARTERLVLGRKIGGDGGVKGLTREIGREILLQLGLLSIYLLGLIGILLLGLIPLLGFFLAPLLGFLWTWFFLAFEFMAPSLSRHGLTAAEQIRTLFSFKALFVGFGAGSQLMLLVPITTPAAVIGGTRLFLALAAHGHVKSRLSDEERAGSHPGSTSRKTTNSR